MTAPSLTFVQAVRDFLDLDADATSRYTDQTIGSNIRQASWFLERATNRLFGARTQGMVFTTNGNPYVTIPGLRAAGTVQWAGSALTANESYWLIPDLQQTGVYTGIQLRGFNQRSDGPAHRHRSDWFDTNADRLWARGYSLSSLPNDLVFGSGTTWGYAEADIPEPVRATTKILAAFLTKYPDAVLVGATQTANGNSIDLSGYPLDVQAFVDSWRVAPGVAGT